ncbi:putative phosphatidylserine decarboxylase [Annulohypoxylon stygium]|nr:putative phosphatidylserine decarboxylase [Annulohypoxylon stygium]
MTSSYEPLVQDFKNWIYRSRDRRHDFHEAIKTAKDVNNGGAGEMSLENINTLEDYFRFCNDFLRWVPKVDTASDAVLRKILVFYWIFNQPDVEIYQTQITPANAGTDPTWLSYWQVLYARQIGSFLDTKDSTSGIDSFYKNPIYNTEADKWEDPPGGEWASFNQFFARHWKDIDEARPLNPDDTADNVVTSAADSRFGDTFPVENGIVEIKGFQWPIKKLLQESWDDFNDGCFMHAFLSPSDYHRQHAPVSGEVLEAKVIPELVYLHVTKDSDSSPGLVADRGLLVKKPLTTERRLKQLLAGGGKKLRSLINGAGINLTEDITAPDDPGYQWCQTRGLIVIQTENYGKVAVLPIGMAQVSSVVLSVEKGQTVTKGDEISYFQFGGSDIVLVFEKPVDYSVVMGDKCNIRTRIATFHEDPTS